MSRTSAGNGVSALVEKIDSIDPFEPGLITVALSGNVCSSFVQKRSFYTAYHVAVLSPKRPMSLPEKLFYCLCIKRNAYRYSWGRQANKTIANLELPDSPPSWVANYSVKPVETNIPQKRNPIDLTTWKRFQLGGTNGLFTVSPGKRLTKEDMTPGTVNYLGAINSNNGVSNSIEGPAIYSGNKITINYNGSVGETFYQPDPYWPSDDVKTLTPNGWTLDKYIALFLCTIINLEKGRFSYGRKWTTDKIESTTLLLPATASGDPDWRYMEQYMKSLPYSDCI